MRECVSCLAREQVLVCVCTCERQGAQVCLCVALTQPDNGRIWTKWERHLYTHMQAHTHVLCIYSTKHITHCKYWDGSMHNLFRNALTEEQKQQIFDLASCYWCFNNIFRLTVGVVDLEDWEMKRKQDIIHCSTAFKTSNRQHLCQISIQNSLLCPIL